MKIHLIGLLAFSIWAVLATNIYVCMILGLCDDSEIPPITEAVLPEAKPADTLELSRTADTLSMAGTNDSLKNGLARQLAHAPNDLTIHFEFDQSDFTPDSGIDKYLVEAKIYLEQNEQALLNIAGHTDESGSKAYNQALAYRRAQRVQLYFINKHLDSNRMLLESFGESAPVDLNNSSTGRANNRRTVITLKK